MPISRDVKGIWELDSGPALEDFFERPQRLKGSVMVVSLVISGYWRVMRLVELDLVGFCGPKVYEKSF